MNNYSIALFFHIVGAMGFFLALGLEWTGLWQLRSARHSREVRVWMSLLKSARRGGFVSMLVVVISGVYLMVTAWSRVAWLVVTVGALVAVIVLALALSGPRMAAVGRTLATEHGEVSQTFHLLANHPLLWISIQTRVAITLGIVLLKAVKPELAGSLLIIGVAFVLGLVSALPMPRRERAHEGSAD